MNNVLNDKNGNILNPKIPRYESRGIVVTLQNTQNISRGVSTVNFSNSNSDNEYFKLNTSTHKIEVLKDCTALISGNCFVDGAEGDGYCWGKIFINEYIQTSQLERIINRDYVNTSIPSKVVNLKSGSEVYMKLDYACSSGNPKIRAQADTTFLSVVKI